MRKFSRQADTSGFETNRQDCVGRLRTQTCHDHCGPLGTYVRRRVISASGFPFRVGVQVLPLRFVLTSRQTQIQRSVIRAFVCRGIVCERLRLHQKGIRRGCECRGLRHGKQSRCLRRSLQPSNIRSDKLVRRRDTSEAAANESAASSWRPRVSRRRVWRPERLRRGCIQ
jgi:hypothetical protein